jgi:hypothetical protein
VARHKCGKAAAGVANALAEVTAARTTHAAEHGRLLDLRKQRDAENIAAADARLQEAVAFHEALPVPERPVSEEEVGVARSAAAAIKVALDGIEREILEAQGTLK